MPSVLFVVTAAEEWTLADGTKRPTGYWAEELIAPHRAFQGAGWDIHFATPGAKAPVVDEYSLEVLPDNVRMAQENYLAELGVALEHPMNLADVNEEDYDLIFYPGGHGPMEDELVARGLDYDKGLLPFPSHVVVDGNLYTGQNPQSSKKLAKTLVDALAD